MNGTAHRQVEMPGHMQVHTGKQIWEVTGLKPEEMGEGAGSSHTERAGLPRTQLRGQGAAEVAHHGPSFSR